MVGWHHQLNGYELGWTPGVGDGQAGLACCDSWGCKESDMNEWLNWLNWYWVYICYDYNVLFFIDPFIIIYFFLFYYILCFKVYFVWVLLHYLFIAVGMNYLFLYSHFRLCVFSCGINLLEAANWKLFFFSYSHPLCIFQSEHLVYWQLTDEVHW